MLAVDIKNKVLLILNKIGPIIMINTQSKANDKVVPDSISRILETSARREKISPVFRESKKDKDSLKTWVIYEKFSC
jgi:hypothetical protein